MSDLSIAGWMGEREVLISGYCEPCFDALFNDDDEMEIEG